MKIDKKKLAIQILAIIGLALSVELAIIYYKANYDQYALSSFCSINDFVDCDGASRTPSSQFLGIPLAYWGIFFYLLVLFLTVVDKFKNVKFLKFLEVFKEPRAYITFLGTIAFLVSMVLAGISLFKIHKLCILCFITYFLDLIIALTAAGGMFKKIVADFKTTYFDFIEGAKKYFKTFIILLIASLTFLAYSGITLNFVPNVKRSRDILKYRNIKYNPYRVKGNILGAKDGDVVIELYSDYVCPLCYIHNIMLHRAAKEFSNIKIVHHNYPFDRVCNPYISYTMHPNACFMSKGALAAAKQGNYWEMSSLLYENQPKTMNEMLKLADKLGFDKTRFINDLQSEEVDDEIQKEIKYGAKLEIDATPTMYINGEKYVGVNPYYQFKETLIKHGAKPRK